MNSVGHQPYDPSSSQAQLRCPACGQQLDNPPPNRCPLCKFGFDDNRATGSDVSPFAGAFARHERGWLAMNRWVWLASAERLKHIALMRSSAASRRFMLLSITVLSIGLGVFQFSKMGWHRVTNTPAIENTGSVKPAGGGWWHIAKAPRPLPENLAPEVYVDFWWNPIHSTAGFILGAALGGLLALFALRLIRAGITKAHVQALRCELRLTAATHYSTAWCSAVSFTLFLAILEPAFLVGAINSWWNLTIANTVAYFSTASVVLGCAMWWFWLIRLGTTAPARTRTRVVLFMSIGIPIIGCFFAFAWRYSIEEISGPVARLLGVQF